MTYPPKPHTERDVEKMIRLTQTFPFAHIFTTGQDGHTVTRLPFMVDVIDDNISMLRAHLNAQNPQAQQLDGAEALITFSGPDSYVSPNWRVDKGRGGTWDYTAVHVWGTITLRPEKVFFETLINDLSNLVEPAYKEISNAPVWSTADAPDGYIDRLLPLLTAFEVKVKKVQGISKLHQDFPKKDAISVAEHLERSDKQDSQTIAKDIKSRFEH